MLNFSITEMAGSIQSASADYLSGPPVKCSVQHSLSADEVKLRMEKKAASVRPEFLPSYEWQGNSCSFSGCARGVISITETSVDIDVQLAPIFGFFRSKLEADLPVKLKLLLEDHFES